MNWPSLISSLSQRGLSQSAIAQLCDCGQSTISDLSRAGVDGKEPRYSLGKSLERLADAPDPQIKQMADLIAAGDIAGAIAISKGEELAEAGAEPSSYPFPDRRKTNRPQHPDLERRAPEAARIAGQPAGAKPAPDASALSGV